MELIFFCVHACTPTHRHTKFQQTFFYDVRKFYFDKKKGGTIIAEGSYVPLVRSHCRL